MDKLNTIFKLSAAITVLLIGLSIFYYFVIFIPMKEKTKQKYLADCINIRQHCNQVANKSMEGISGTFEEVNRVKEFNYRTCLRDNGLEE